MIVPTCSRCDRPFPANNELASLPHGTRVAFDPALGRVWRICTSCGDWNLLGPETAMAAVAELRGRLPAIQRDAIVHDAVGSVEIITVAGGLNAAVTDPSAARARRSYSRWRALARSGIAMDVVLYAAIWYPVLSNELDWRMVRFTAGSTAWLVAGRLAGSAILRWRRYGAVRRWEVAVASTAAIVGTIIGLFGSTFAAASTAAMAFLGLGSTFAMNWFDRLFAGAPVTASSGQIIQVSPDDEASFNIGIDANGDLVAHAPRTGLSFRGRQVHALITALTDVSATRPYSSHDVEMGWSILRQHRDVEGVVAALGEIRPEHDHRHSFTTLPGAWKAALHFGAIESSGTDAERDAIREQIAAASEVAAIAESLDAAPDASRLKPRLGEPKH